MQIVDMYRYLLKNYITYDRLFALNKKAFYERSDADHVDIFIDIHSMIKDIFGRGKSMEDFIGFTYANTSVISSSMINLCAHLRNYYFTRHRVWATFYLVWAWNKPENVISIIPSYNAHIIMAEEAKTIQRGLVNDNIGIMKTICPFLPDIFFINGGNYEAITVIGSLINNYGRGRKGIPSIIYSRDPLGYLAVNKLPLTFMFRPKKANNEDRSYLVSKTNLIDTYLEKELKQVPYEKDYDPNKFHDYIAYAGIRAKGLKPALRFKQTMDYFNGRNLYFSTEEQQRIFANSYATDIITQIQVFESSPEAAEIPSNVINLVSPEEVKQLNNLYFQEYPLDLNAL